MRLTCRARKQVERGGTKNQEEEVWRLRDTAADTRFSS